MEAVQKLLIGAIYVSWWQTKKAKLLKNVYNCRFLLSVSLQTDQHVVVNALQQSRSKTLPILGDANASVPSS